MAAAKKAAAKKPAAKKATTARKPNAAFMKPMTPSAALAKVVGAGPLCMCNPADHPAGRYGKASLEALGLWESVAQKIAIANDPQAAVVQVTRGEAPAAIVFATDVKDVPGTRIIGTFPDASHPPIVYPVALTMAAPHADAAERLLAYLKSAEARTLFDRYGYR